LADKARKLRAGLVLGVLPGRNEESPQAHANLGWKNRTGWRPTLDGQWSIIENMNDAVFWGVR
jgi:hypothetical protein